MIDTLTEIREDDQSIQSEYDNLSEDGAADYPKGVILRFQPQKKHEKLILDNPDVSTLMLNIEYAERLTRKNKTAKSYFGPQKDVIITSTIPDEKLELWDIQREVRLAKEFNPDFYVPCDYPVYKSHSRKKRIDFIEGYVRELEDFKNRIKNVQTSIIPLVKGYSEKERRICYRSFEKLGLNYIAYYCAQYFGGQVGNRFNDLLETIHNIVVEFSPIGILLVGLLSQKKLRQFPPNVVAAAGQRWIMKSGLRDDIGEEEKKQNLANWMKEVEKALRSSQTNLKMFDKGVIRDGNWDN
ncbi:MAG: hypothetical protein ACOCSL_06070 [Thermoplasmatota archaeon]